jgi:hypothetical protein
MMTHPVSARHSLSLVIPTVAPYTSCKIPQQFLQSGLTDRFDLQLVFMQNAKAPRPQSETLQIDGVDAIVVGNDRYFGSCEENIFRVRDLGRVLRDMVLVVGEHDRIDWAALCGALDFAAAQRLEIVGLNVLGCQLRGDGTEAQLPAVPALEGEATANLLVRQLLAGAVLDGSLALPALMSTYGPIDWSAFIGNHLYSRAALMRILQYRQVEHVYSFPYMQLQYLADSRLRYGFYNGTPIHRISAEHDKARQGKFSWGWLVEHRRVQGASDCFWVANLSHLHDLDDDALFLLLVNGRNIAQVAGADENTVFHQNFMLQGCLMWCHAVLAALVTGNSHYLGRDHASASLMDARYLLNFLTRLVRTLEQPRMQAAHAGVAALCAALRPVPLLLRSYLVEPHASEQTCVLAASKVAHAMPLLAPEMMLALNHASFDAYADQWTR